MAPFTAVTALPATASASAVWATRASGLRLRGDRAGRAGLQVEVDANSIVLVLLAVLEGHSAGAGGEADGREQSEARRREEGGTATTDGRGRVGGTGARIGRAHRVGSECTTERVQRVRAGMRAMRRQTAAETLGARLETRVRPRSSGGATHSQPAGAASESGARLQRLGLQIARTRLPLSPCTPAPWCLQHSQYRRSRPADGQSKHGFFSDHRIPSAVEAREYSGGQCVQGLWTERATGLHMSRRRPADAAAATEAKPRSRLEGLVWTVRLHRFPLDRLNRIAGLTGKSQILHEPVRGGEPGSQSIHARVGQEVRVRVAGCSKGFSSSVTRRRAERIRRCGLTRLAEDFIGVHLGHE